ncbi:MAG: Excinuclease ABC C subunit domain protein [Candidatus Falkowbacteria bacterium GW2011_GWC2_38_22]|uniref:Excinuclease ABC C subunit domain protein n=1 Tax=Candidatus Falkowbacteria bacterium GW2011_GWE1_38_31 TaxID=1618638 RepID=A0A0G0K518_9BACT|nr:MAG: Excinuclease ABC C subunit domain protein [Candidatus Falkowbacteria bacterium GW2011_GWF2_38_1205]KKQ61693.1 MAG: Excinuclease ABC C subunit domain protein [Candidatus Falkowbacteria bacterium GW2011_GWC2_38_22]KKQ63692.1 MAG: Excinuclease ABC C subunit domain protein [Candidatus Falkowbacteria bacterium GW2011_GWF1_38_22]KKQ65892.1 MAG: Excinuclease ABC C subunit domain protein [Candidatus Falkowbacteria bacterium GW2011_GWE2_38_254]KKQ70555.1 MAG: Excinuclease ABC C subunit domain pr
MGYLKLDGIPMYYVYLLHSGRDKKFYIGYSSDLSRRFAQHQQGLVESTKHRRPLELIYYESYQTNNLALEREKKLKQFGSAYVGLLKRLKIK